MVRRVVALVAAAIVVDRRGAERRGRRAETATSAPHGHEADARRFGHLRPRGRDQRRLVHPAGPARDLRASWWRARSTTRSTVPNSTGKIVPYLAKSVTHDPTYTQWTITLRDGMQVPRRHAAHRRRGEAEHRRLAQGPAARVRLHQRRRRRGRRPARPCRSPPRCPGSTSTASCTSPDRVGIAAPAQLDNPDTCPTNLIGTGPFMIYNGAGHWIQNQEFVATAQPELLAEGQERHAAPLPRQDHVQAQPRRRAAPEPAPGRAARHDAHDQRPGETAARRASAR